MDDVVTKEDGRELSFRADYIEHLIYIQEKLDEEIMVTTLTFDECFNMATKILDDMKGGKLKVV